jgi:hypothetical protein
MKLLNFLDFIKESKEKVLLPVVFSDEFKDKLDNIDNSFISSSFKQLYNTETDKEYTLISIGNSEDTISYIDSYKLVDYKGDIRKLKSSDDLWKKNRTDVKVGRFINKFFPNTFTDRAIEDFVNKWKSATSKSPNFQVWKGPDIKNAYKSNDYHFAESSNNPLMNSCMNDEIHLVDFYSYCPTCSVIVLLDDDNKILGRALLWKDSEGRMIMDRVYYVYDKDYYKFIRLANDHDWYYKKRNISGGSSFIKNGQEFSLKSQVKVPDVFKFFNDGFPYMDTFYYAQGEWAMNYQPESGKYFGLQDTEGGFEEFEDFFGYKNIED